MASRQAPADTLVATQLRAEPVSPLLRALLLPAAEAQLAWREWRVSANLDKLSEEDFFMLPVLGGRLTQWLAGDPAAGIVRGVLRRAWTENQVRLSTLRSTVASLEGAGCGPVLVAGSAAIHLLNTIEGSTRHISDFRVVVPRDRIASTAAALESSGWRLSSQLPKEDLLDWVPMVHFSRPDLAGQNQSLMLQWRILGVPATKALACEEEFLHLSLIHI